METSSYRPNGPHAEKNTNFGGNMEHKADISGAANHLLEEGKKLANEIYESNAHKIGEAQETLKTYSKEITNKVQTNPLSALVIAGTIGFLLAKITGK